MTLDPRPATAAATVVACLSLTLITAGALVGALTYRRLR